MTIISTPVFALVIAFIALAVVVAIASVAVVSQVVTASRRDRLSRNESFRSYYGRVATSN